MIKNIGVDQIEVDRIAKGRASGDAWRELERLLVAVAEPRAMKLMAS